MSTLFRPRRPSAKREPVWSTESTWTMRHGTKAAAAIDLWRVDLRQTAETSGTTTNEGRTDQAGLDEESLALLTSSERSRAGRLRIESKRRQFVRTRSQLRRVLARYLEAEPLEIEIEAGEHGKLEVIGGPAFNVSHSGQLAVIAIAASGLCEETQLGVDIERQRSGRPLDRMAQRFFADRESAVYSALEEGERETDFYRRWALKEAYVKALGTGLTYSSRAFVLADDPVSWQARSLLESCERHPSDRVRWLFRNGWLEFPREEGAGEATERYALAVCASGPGAGAELRFFEAG